MAKLGPDPLREDADRERLWAVMQKSKKSIGQLLMDQSAVAGIGNIYRAEILFKARSSLPLLLCFLFLAFFGKLRLWLFTPVLLSRRSCCDSAAWECHAQRFRRGLER